MFSTIYIQKRSDGGKQGTTPKKLKKDKVVVGATAKAHRSDSVAASGAPRVKPELALPVMYIYNNLVELCFIPIIITSVLFHGRY